MNNYTLYVHSENTIPGFQHSGFQLGIPTENGMIYHTIDLSPNSEGKIEFKYDSYTEGETVPYTGKTQIATGSDAIEAYNKLMLATSALNFYTDSLDYNIFIRNCNSSSVLLAEKYIPGFADNGSRIFDNLPGVFIGDEVNFLQFNPYFKNALYGIDNIITILENEGIDLGSDLLDITAFDDYILISNGDTTYKLDRAGNFWEENDAGEFQTYLSRAFSQCLIPFDTLFSVSPLWGTAETTTSPLIVDLDGDGVETVSTNNGIHFDHDSNGFAENTGWVGKDDGILIRDLNGDGQVNDGSELFGNNTILSNGQKAANGFEALKDLDSNGDGVFDQNDTAWNEVKVWKDSNQNGIVDNNELLTLEQANISGINLDYQTGANEDLSGNAHKQTSTITKTDGTTSTITDVWFDTDHANSIDTSHITIPDDIKAMPEVAGFGNVHSLQTAMALDESGALKDLVEQYAAETDAAARSAILDNIIYHWTGVQNMSPNGRDPSQVYGKVIDDTRKLEALEEFMGRDYLGTWCWGTRDPNPHGRAAPFILQAYDILKDYVNNSLLPQTIYKSMLDSIPITYNSTTGQLEADATAVLSAWESGFTIDPDGTVSAMKEFAGILHLFGANSIPVINAIRGAGNVEGNAFQQELLEFGQWEEVGSEGNDALYGDDGNNYLNGKGGNDNLFGNGGDDILIGGAGNDYLVGGNGKDIYHFDVGFGNDCIDNMQDESAANEDIIRFGEGISPDKVTLGRQGFDLIITVSYDPDEDGTVRPSDSVRVYSYFDKQGTTSATVSAITFADETSWNYDYVSTHWNSVPDVNGGITNEGNNDDNYLSGTDANDILIGNGGNDVLYGYSGNDILYGGKGNDTLDGGSGDDTYLYNLGDGLDKIMDSGNRDKISFGEGICFEDLSFSLVNYNYLKITVKGDPNQGLIIQNYNAGLSYKIEDLYFHDGKIVHLSEIPLTYQQNDKDEILYLSDNGDTVYAKGGDDRIEGGMGDDVIIGGKGWDIINSGQGNNTFVWNLGDGFDTIYNGYDSSNTVKFGAGITLSNLTFRLDATDLIIIVNGDETQGMRLQNKDYLRYLKFADGFMVDLSTAELVYQQTDARENSLNYTNNKDVIFGGAGDDTISAFGGDDVISGGKGCDTLMGGAGDDTYVWNSGDGLDTVSDYEGTNTVQFGTGIALSDLTFEKSGFDFRIYVNGDRTQGLIFNQCEPHVLKFADGTVYQMAEHGLNIHNSDNDDNNVTGSLLDDVIYGGGGDDVINALAGNDTLSGGKGTDTLIGGAGDDTYLWNLGDGFDTIMDDSGTDKIKFGEGITLDDLSFAQGDNGCMEIYVKGDRSQGLRLSGQFVNGGTEQIETLEFTDGSTFDLMNSEIEFVDYQRVVIDNRRQPVEITEMNGSDGADQMTNSYDYSVTFNGGKGNDYYNGGGGADTYIYNLGDGLDYINDNSGDNKLKFGPGISFADLTFRFGNTGQFMILVDEAQTQGVKCSSAQTIRYLEFADGSVIDLTTRKLAVLQGDGDDSIKLADGRINMVNLGAGNDILYNQAGNDITIIGGKGNDEIHGSSGKDTFIWNLGDGMDNLQGTEVQDKIVFGAGITAEDLTFRLEADGLRIIVKQDENQGMLISNYQPYYTDNLKNLYFADGSHLDLSQGLTLQQTNADDTVSTAGGNDIVYGGVGNDVISTAGGNDILIGGTGNDTLTGGYGDDTYVYNLGDGFDTISDEGGNDKIIFGQDITQDNLHFEKIDSDLKITVNGNEEAGMLIKNQFSGNAVESVEFADGSNLDISKADLLIQAMSSFGGSSSAISDLSGSGVQDVSEMYSIAASPDIAKHAA